MEEVRTAGKPNRKKQTVTSRIVSDMLFSGVSLWLLLLGIRLGLVTAFDGTMNLTRYGLLFLGVAFLLVVFVIQGRIKRVLISTALALGALGLYVWRQWDTLQQQAMVLAYYMDERYYAYVQRHFFDKSMRAEGVLDKNILLTLICIVLVYCMALLVFRLRQAFIGFIPVYFVFMAGLLFGKAPSKLSITLLMLGCGIALAVVVAKQPIQHRKRRLQIREKQKKAWSKLPVRLPAICLLGISLVLGYAVSGKMEDKVLKLSPDFQKKELEIEENIIRQVSNFAQYIKGVTGFGGDGMLSNAAPHYTDSKVMEVTVDFKPHTAIYLRGFTGETYRNGHWSKVNEKDLKASFPNEKDSIWRRNYDQMKRVSGFLSLDDSELNRFLYRSFYEYQEEEDDDGYIDYGDREKDYQTSDFLSYIRGGLEDSIHGGNITVKYVGKERFRKTAYLPYFSNLYDKNGTGAVVKTGGDGNLARKGSRYTTEMYLISQRKLPDYVEYMDSLGWMTEDVQYTAGSLMETEQNDSLDVEYSGTETVDERYQQYASTHYGQLNDGGLPLYQQLIKESYKNQGESPDVLATVREVQQILWLNTSYNLDLKPVPMGNDYAEYFLFVQQKGYCEHYATAATILLREFNVPARYVSGYRIDNRAFKENGDGTYTAKVKDSDAHAWTETLQQYTGWTPWEVTPSDGDETSEEEEESRQEREPADATETPERTLEPPEEVKRVQVPEQTEEPSPTPSAEPEASAVPKADSPDGTDGGDNIHRSSLSVGQLAAIAAGALFVLVLIAVPLVCRIRQGRRRQRILKTKARAGKRATGYCMAYLVDALRIAGNKMDKNAEERDWMQVLEQSYGEVLTQTERGEMLRLAQAGAYSRSGTSVEEQNRLWSLCRKVLRSIPERCRLPRRLFFCMIFKKE